MKTPWDYLTSVDRIIVLHEQGIVRYGGDFGPPREGCVDGGLGAAWNAELYTEAEGAIHGFNFACFLLVYLAKDHCFTDGNKRVAWLAFVDILLKLGLTIEASTTEVEGLMLSIILGKMERSQVSVWAGERIQAVN